MRYSTRLRGPRSMLNHALKPQQNRLKSKTGVMSENRLMPLARAAVSSWSALNRPKTSSVAVSRPMGSAEDPDERDQQADGFEHRAQARLAADEQREDFLEHVAEQQHKREHRHGEQQRGEHLGGQIFVQRFQGPWSFESLMEKDNGKFVRGFCSCAGQGF